jgi:hypothetical protein
MQSDGNLVLYGPDGAALWSTGTSGEDCSANQCLAVFQTDGNLVVYNGSTPLWSSGTSGRPDAELLLSAQSPQLQILGGDQSMLWANVYAFGAGNFTLNQNTSVDFYSLTLAMQGDGNLVLYGPDGTPLWDTGTFGQDCGTNQCYVTFQSDGNLVVYNGSTPLWSSGTSGDPGAQLVLYPDSPEIEIIGSDQSVLYANARQLRANQKRGSTRHR